MAKRALRYEASWLAHAVGFRPNPLRRGVDRLTGVATIVVVVMAMLAVPICATVATVVRDQQSVAVQQEAATRHQVAAVLTQDAQIGSSDNDARGMDSRMTADVQWRDERGDTHSAVAPVRAGAHRGDTTTVWVDQASQITEAPRSQINVTVSAVLLAFWLLLVVELACFGLIAGIRRLGYSYAWRAWEREWEIIERHWKWPQY